jgi:hypothetical protein
MLSIVVNMRVVFSFPFLFLVLSLVVFSFPYFVYGFFVGLDLWWGFRLWVGFMGFGHYMFLLLQVAYYACRLPLVYVAAGGVVFLLFFFSMAAPGLVALAPVGFFAAVALALFFGVRSGVFHYSWLVAVVWIFLWNLVGGLLSIPARLVFGAGEMWLWWEQPPAHPAYALAVGAAGAAATSILGRSKTLVKRLCQAAPPCHM